MSATRLLDHLADLAGERSRGRLDACFVTLFEDLLGHAEVRVLRPPADQEAAPDPSTDIVQTPGTPHLALVPMAGGEEMSFHVQLATPQPLTAEELRIVSGVQRFHRHLRHLVDENERDSLTRLLNRKSFDETFVRMALQMDEWPDEQPPEDTPERRQQRQAPCWLGVVDIDHFKLVNDQHGHLLGDEVLILLAHQMRANFRRRDNLYRFGGEEFVVLLRQAEPDDAMAAFERLRARVEGFEFPQVGRLTISAGITAVLDSDTPSAAFERADQAVYHAKQHGRNRVADYETLVATGAIAVKAQASGIEFF